MVTTKNLKEEEEFTFIGEWGKASKITENIFQGNHIASLNKADLKANGITHILCAGNSLKCYFKNEYKYLKIDVDDTEYENMLPEFQRAFEFIDDCITNGGKILIHCAAGISRSSTFTCAYFIKKNKMTFNEALDLLKKGRPIAEPNQGFAEQLDAWYTQEVLHQPIDEKFKSKEGYVPNYLITLLRELEKLYLKKQINHK